ncbi:MAG: adenylate kinase [Fibrobacterota bacterium]
MNIILFGPPGVGKGTQATLLKDKFNLLHVSTGEALRNEVAKGTELGKKAKAIMDSGKLVSDDIVAGIVASAMQNTTGKNGVMLDGFPRTVTQAEILDRLCAEKKLRIDHVISLEAEKELILKRLAGRRSCDTCGKDYNVYFNPPKVEGECDSCDGGRLAQRTDDTEEAHLKRLNVYEAQTEPVKGYYAKKELLRTVDGTGTPEDVFCEVSKILA